jgi:hypothetical protein
MKAFIAAALAWCVEMDGLRIKRVQMEPVEDKKETRAEMPGQDEKAEEPNGKLDPSSELLKKVKAALKTVEFFEESTSELEAGIELEEWRTLVDAIQAVTIDDTDYLTILLSGSVLDKMPLSLDDLKLLAGMEIASELGGNSESFWIEKWEVSSSTKKMESESATKKQQPEMSTQEEKDGAQVSDFVGKLDPSESGCIEWEGSAQEPRAGGSRISFRLEGTSTKVKILNSCLILTDLPYDESENDLSNLNFKEQKDEHSPSLSLDSDNSVLQVINSYWSKMHTTGTHHPISTSESDLISATLELNADQLSKVALGATSLGRNFHPLHMEALKKLVSLRRPADSAVSISWFKELAEEKGAPDWRDVRAMLGVLKAPEILSLKRELTQIKEDSKDVSPTLTKVQEAIDKLDLTKVMLMQDVKDQQEMSRTTPISGVLADLVKEVAEVVGQGMTQSIVMFSVESMNKVSVKQNVVKLINYCKSLKKSDEATQTPEMMIDMCLEVELQKVVTLWGHPREISIEVQMKSSGAGKLTEGQSSKLRLWLLQNPSVIQDIDSLVAEGAKESQEQGHSQKQDGK